MNIQAIRNTVVGGLFLIPFIPLVVSSEFFFPFITTKAFSWRIIVEVIFAAWLLLVLIDAEYRPKMSLVLYTVITFLVVIGLADVFGVAPLKSLWSNFERMEGYLALLHLGMFFVVITSVLRESEWRAWWNASLVASFLMVLYCVLQLLGVKTINQGGVRVDGTLGNAIYLAVYMLFHMFIATLFMWRNWQNAALRWVYGILVILQGSILYFTATRGAILGLIGGVLVIALLNIRNRESVLARRASIIILIIIALLASGFFAIRNTQFVQTNPVLARFASLNTEELKTQGRYFVWPMALEGFKERPILGWGQENFTYVFQKYYKPNMYHLEPWFDRAHNIFLDWLVVGGIVGLAAYLSLYAALLWIAWRRSNLSYTEKTIITGLVAAYFFHNIFVFDHLISYILFFSLLGYINFRGGRELALKKTLPQGGEWLAVPLVVIVLVTTIYMVNIRPLQTNLHLINALQGVASGSDPKVSIDTFKKSYDGPYLGKTEVVEQITANAIPILTSNLSMEEKNEYFAFVSGVIRAQAEDESIENDSRYQLLAGSFFTATGLTDEGLERLDRARELIPNKQQVYFEIGSAYINKNERARALEVFKQAYDLDPEYIEARIIYLIGAIYVDARGIESEMLNITDERLVIFDDRVINAYYANGRIDRVRELLNKRIELDPQNTSKYQEVLNSIPRQ